MSRPTVKFVATYANGKTLDELSATIAKRQKYLNETAFQSVHATAVNALKTIRTATRVAKPSGIKVDVTPRADLTFSYTRESAAGSRGRAKMCIRSNSGVRFEDGQIGKIMFVDCHGVKAEAVKVYQFKDTGEEKTKTYIIAATSPSKARGCAQRIVARRVLRFAGLAKKAVSALMVKTNNKGPADAVSFRVASVAARVTSVGRVCSSGEGSGTFRLEIRDDLRYAARALKGGHAAVDQALKKAANMSIGRIKQKCGDLLMPGELRTPFPEVTRRRAL